MRKQRLSIGLLIFLLVCPLGSALASAPNADLKKKVTSAMADLHLPFVENKGQVADPKVAFVADTFACRVSVTRDGQIVYGLPADKKGKGPGGEIKERLVGEGAKIRVRGQKSDGAMVSYFPGRDASQWKRNVPTFEQVHLGRVAPGIEMALSAHGRNVEKLFYVEPGADPSAIRLGVEGAKGLSIRKDGELELATAVGAMRFSQPVAYQEINGEKRMVKVSYQVSENTYGFALGNYDTTQQLVIDPLITVFPISQSETHNLIEALATDAEGNVYAAGGAGDQLAIFKLDSRLDSILASVRFSEDAYYRLEMIYNLVLDRHGNVIVAGTTINSDFPVTEGCHDNRIYDGTYQASPEGFVTKFSADLSTMIASTFVGGDGWEEIKALVVDEHDQVYVAGNSRFCGLTGGQEFPITGGAFDETPLEKYYYQGMVVKLDPTLSTVLAATYLGGHECDNNGCKTLIHCLALDADGNLWAAGHTDFPDFPTTDGSLDSSYNGGGDIFLSKMDPDLTQLLVSTHIGGLQDEEPTDMLFDAQGDLYLLGWTYSTDFPMPAGGYMPEHSNYEEDGFILKLNASANEILAGTFLGGAYDGEGYGDDDPAAMVFSADGSVLYVVGRTESRSFPTTADCYSNILDNGELRISTLENAWTPPRDYWDFNGGDGFLASFSADLTRLLYSTFLGGNRCDYLDAIAINGSDIIIAGEASTGFPMIETEETGISSMGALLKFSEGGTTPQDPDTPESQDDSGGGGGGGCFVSTLF